MVSKRSDTHHTPGRGHGVQQFARSKDNALAYVGVVEVMVLVVVMVVGVVGSCEGRITQ